MSRIGLLGGSFDPVHTGHLALAHTALAHLQLDELRWVPAGHAWQKQGAQASGPDRAAMVRAAIADEPRFVLDRCELDRDGPSYTLDTVKQLQAAQPDAHWYLVIGQDQYANLHTWKDWPELLSLVTLAVAGRDQALPDVRHTPLGAVPHRVIPLPMPPVPVSASAIRAQLAAGQSALSLGNALVPAAVASYIARHGLYRHPTTPSHPRS